MPITPPKCKICKKEEWNHVCGGLQGGIAHLAETHNHKRSVAKKRKPSRKESA